jgi:hypothetical protein
MGNLTIATDIGGVFREVAAFPAGTANDGGITGVTINGKNAVRSKKGVHTCEEVGIFANGIDQAFRLHQVMNHAKINVLNLHAEAGGAVVINGVVTIPALKKLALSHATTITGTGSINGGVLDAPLDAAIFSDTITINFDQVSTPCVSARWFGVSPSRANNQIALQRAADFAFLKGLPLYIKQGTYRTGEVVFRCSVEGDPGFKTILTGIAGTTGNFICSLGFHSSSSDWEMNSFSNIKIEGETGAHNGIRIWNMGQNFGHPYNEFDALAGRWKLSHVMFNKCRTYAIRKPFGNIGNVFESCSFEGGSITEFFYHATSQNNPAFPMHTGNDLFDSTCHFRGSKSAVFYVDCQVEGGMFKVPNCVIEANLGFICYVKNGSAGNTLGNPYTFENVHLESNSFADSIPTIDGVTLTVPYHFYFNNCSPVVFREMAHGRVLAINSNITLDNCNHYVNDGYISRTNSIVTTRNPFGFFFQDTNSIAEGIVTFNQFAKLRRPFPAAFINGHANLLRSDTLDNAYAMPNGYTGARVADSMLGKYCLEVTMGNGESYISTAPWSVPANKILVIGLGIKRPVGAAVTILYTGSAGFDGVTVEGDNTWHYTYCIRPTGAGVDSILVWFKNQVGTVRLSHLQVLAFDTREEAGLFIMQNTFVKTPEPRTTWGTGVPAGSLHETYDVGDTIMNSNPTLNSPLGWRCITAGTPGTFEALQTKRSMDFYSFSENNNILLSNLYWDGTVWRYKTTSTGGGSFLQFYDGELVYAVAASGVAGAIATPVVRSRTGVNGSITGFTEAGTENSNKLASTMWTRTFANAGFMALTGNQSIQGQKTFETIILKSLKGTGTMPTAAAGPGAAAATVTLGHSLCFRLDIQASATPTGSAYAVLATVTLPDPAGGSNPMVVYAPKNSSAAGHPFWFETPANNTVVVKSKIDLVANNYYTLDITVIDY